MKKVTTRHRFPRSPGGFVYFRKEEVPMKQRMFHAALACIFAGSVLCAATAQARGQVVIQPKISIGGQYNSNFWKTEEEEVSAYTYYAGPGVLVGYETQRTQLLIDGTLDLYWYDQQDDTPLGFEDAEELDYVGTSILGRINYQATDKINLGLRNELYITRYPARTLNFVNYDGRSDGNSNDISRDKYTLNHFEPNIYYEFSERVGLQLKYRNTLTDYEKDLEDSVENRGSASLFYNLNRDSAIFLDYQIWQRDYDEDSNDYLSNKITLNYQQTYSYWAFRGGAGYHNRSFDDDGLDDIDLPSWQVQVRGQEPDTDRRTARSRVLLDFGQELNDDGTGDSYYTATFISLELGYRFYERFVATLKGAYQNSDYEVGERDEDTYQAAARLSYYVLDYVTLGIDVGLENRDSNIPGNDYDDNYVMLTLGIDYDLKNL